MKRTPMSDQFGEAVADLLKTTRLSPYDVQRLSEGYLSHQTVRNAMRGAVPSSDHIVELVDAVGNAMEWPKDRRAQEADRLLRLAGSRVVYARVMLALAA